MLTFLFNLTLASESKAWMRVTFASEAGSNESDQVEMVEVTCQVTGMI